MALGILIIVIFVLVFMDGIESGNIEYILTGGVAVFGFILAFIIGVITELQKNKDDF